jgi:ATP-dependent Clp protease adaptor protein ClpS
MGSLPFELDGKPDEETLDEVRPPRRFRVLLHNDDYTTMDFVVEVLVSIFRMPPTEAARTMLEVHHKGVGVAGVMSREEAETRIERVHELARQRGFPLECTWEEA